MAIDAAGYRKDVYDKANEVGGSGVTATFTVETQTYNPATGEVTTANTNNLATSGTAIQVDTFSGAEASRAIDGNTTGDWALGSLSSTTERATPWWQLDLGGVKSIDKIKVWNRSDAATDRLSNFDVFVSDNPFISDDPAVIANQAGVIRKHTAGEGGRPTTFEIDATGRYVRVQLLGTNYLTLAEVEVFASSNAIAAQVFVTEYESNRIGTGGIEANDVKMIVPDYDLGFVPDTGKSVTVGGKTYRIVNVKPTKIADTTLMHECQLRV